MTAFFLFTSGLAVFFMIAVLVALTREGKTRQRPRVQPVGENVTMVVLDRSSRRDRAA